MASLLSCAVIGSPLLFGHDYAMGDQAAQEAAAKSRPYPKIRKSL
jgi:hypothetical protein